MIKHMWTAVRGMLVLTVVLGILYPLTITGVGQLALNDKANGQLITLDGDVVGSAIIGQSFADADGAPLPEWFQSRPSAAGDGYDASASSGSNYGPENTDLIAAIGDRQAQIVASDDVDVSDIPADAVTASASGLDPHISPDFARLQVERVAAARGLDAAQVSELVESMVQGRDLGYLGEPTVNVLQLNIALSNLR